MTSLDNITCFNRVLVRIVHILSLNTNKIFSSNNTANTSKRRRMNNRKKGMGLASLHVPAAFASKIRFFLFYLLATIHTANCSGKSSIINITSALNKSHQMALSLAATTVEPTARPQYNKIKQSLNTSHPTRPPKSEPLASNQQTAHPTPLSIMAHPTPQPETEHPTPLPITAHPTPMPKTDHPTPMPKTDHPTRMPKTDHPTPKPNAGRPTPKPNTGRPTPKPNTDHPTARPMTEINTLKPVRRPPTQRPETVSFVPMSVPAKVSTAHPRKAPAIKAQLTQSPTKNVSKHQPSKPSIIVLLPTDSAQIEKRESPTTGTRNPTHDSKRKPSTYSPSLYSKPSTEQPTLSLKPSMHPSAQPSLPLQVGSMIKNIAMIFDDCKSLGSMSIKRWVNVTSTFIASEIMKGSDERKISYLDARIFFRKQFVPVEQSTGNTTTGAHIHAVRHQRYLQQSSPLALFFDLKFTFRSPIVNHPNERFFIETLDTKEKRINYINQLQNSGDSVFNSINDVQVLLDGHDISQVSKSKTLSEETNPVRISRITGIATGLLAAAILATSFIIVRVKKGNKRKEECPDYMHSPIEGIKAKDVDSVYIVVSDASVDISTLGTPLEAWKSSPEKFEDVTIGESTLKCDYEYKNYVSGHEKHRSQNGDSGPAGKIDSDNKCLPVSPDSDQENTTLRKKNHALTNPQVGEAIICDEDSFDEIFKSSGCDSCAEANGSPPKLAVFNTI